MAFKTGTKVYLGVYTHRHGTDVAVYATPELAMRGREWVARDMWEQEFEEPLPAGDVADLYFERKGFEEDFEVWEREIVMDITL